jgi:hypothetical protein
MTPTTNSYSVRELLDYSLPIPVEDRAMMLRERIDEQETMEEELTRLRREVDELQADVDECNRCHADEDDIEEIKGALKELVAAFDKAKIGKMARVGSLVICVEQDANMVLGGALERARKAL